jgi:glycosyltransferase involved in cell wall biosynthesis
MRIAIIAPPWVPVPPPGYGGTESVLDSLARGLVAAGHEVLLYATGDSTCPVETRWVLERAAGTVSTGSSTELHHVIHAYEEVRRWGADVVHDHTLVGPVHGTRFDLPIVTTNHGPFDSELGALYRTLGTSVAIIAISRQHAASAVDTPVAAVIHHGVDVDRIAVGPGAGGYALFLGRMSPDKGVHTAIDAARCAGIPLKIAAKMREPAERQYFREHIAPRLGGAVEFIGEVGGPHKLQLLAEAQCLLNPLAWPEPFGMVMVEALAVGTPVVATPCGSVPELVVDGVTGFVRDGVDELAAAVSASGSLDRTACRQDAVARFSTDRMVAEHVALYERAIATRRAGCAA